MSTYGQSPGPFTASYSGFKNGDTAAALSGSPSLTTTATSSSPAGNYAITAAVGTLSATNYTFAFVNGTLTVGKATLTVTANNAMSTYGQTPGPFTASYGGFVNGDTQAVLTGSPSLTTTATASSPAGNYAITAAVGTLSATNYTFTFVNGTLTVGKATLTVTANNAVSTFGQTPGPFTAAYTGFVNGDTSAVLSGSPSLTTTATASSPAGTYPINAAQGTLSAANYTFTFVNGTLTVNNPMPSITGFSPAFAIVGSAAQTLTINGTNFISGATVTYNNLAHPATFVNANTVTILLSLADQMSVGNFPVVVTNPAPSLGPSAPVNFPVDAAGPAVTLSSASVPFGSVYLGDTLTASSVTLTNTGGSTLNFSSIAITGTNALDFSQSNTCGGTLTAGNSCSITTMFSPSLTAPESAAVTIMDNAADSPQSIMLSGTGIVASGQFMALDATKKFLVNTTVSPAKPVFLTAEDAFSLVDELSNADIETYLADRASKGYNLIWIAAVDNTYNTHPPFNALGQAPFGSSPFTQMQEPYFEHLSYVIQRAASYGITVLLNPAFSGFTCDDTGGWCAEMVAATDTTMTAYGVYLGNRFKSFPNIIWLIGGDLNITAQGITIKNRNNDIATGIKSVDTVHLMTVENIRGQSSMDQFAGEPWLDLNGLYNIPTDFPSAANMNYTRSGALPLFEMEDYYEGEHSMTALALRTEAYWAVLSGAYLGQFFGNNAIWNFGNPAYDTLDPTWQNQLNSTGSVDRQRLGKLFRSREHWLMVPDISASVVTACSPSCGSAAAGTLVTAAKTSDGQTIFAYVPNGSSTVITVNMTKITSSSGSIHGWWFNPRTGATSDLGLFSNTGSMMFTAPDSNDWVLVLDDKSAGLPAPGSADL